MSKLLWALVVCSVAAAAFGAPPPPPQPQPQRPKATAMTPAQLHDLGVGLVDEYFSRIAATSANATKNNATARAAATAHLLDMFSPAYQIVRGDGTRDTKATYTPPSLTTWEIRDARVTALADGVVVVRYNLTAPGEAQFGRALGSTLRPRLTVFSWDAASQEWKVVSHANFNKPQVWMCAPANQTQRAAPARRLMAAAASAASASSNDTAAVTALAARLIETEAEFPNHSHPQHQSQYADGSGHTSSAEHPFLRNGTIDGNLIGLLATRDGDLLVASFNTSSNVTEPYNPGYDYVARHAEAAPAPRLFTFMHSPDGQLPGNWSVITFASFSVYTLPSDDPACVIGGGDGVRTNAAGSAVPHAGGAHAAWVALLASAAAQGLLGLLL